MDRVRLVRKSENVALPSCADAHDLEFHPLADLFPLLEGADFEDLVADARVHGVREPIWMFEGKILDGRNRYRAAAVAGVPCPTRVYEGNDPVGFVVSLNLKRRHLNESQRAMVAAKLATMRQGARTDLSPIGEKSQAEAAELLNVGKRSVERAAEVRDHGSPELVHAVEAGKVAVSVAANIASLPIEEQREIVARCDKREVLEVAKRIRAERAAERRAEWNARIIEMSKANAPLPRDRRYPVILADPPWQFKVYDAASGLDHAAEAHYPCMSTEEISAMPIAEIAMADAALFLWTTAPHLEESLCVLKAWGFRYVTHAVWDKGKTGLGYWLLNQHEVLLIGARGDMRSPAEGSRPPSVIKAPRREHSRKPDEAYEIIERMYPELPKIELFARGQRKGWSVWGNESEAAA